MNQTKLSSKFAPKQQTMSQQSRSKLQKPETKKPTLGQRLADAMASKVGSWSFLIGQTTVLVGWIGANTMPGVPHWDESPFILLNLMFSFASAYTAPVVLMSQNRQSDEDRENALFNHQVNLEAAHQIELLHEKIDQLQSRQMSEIAQMLKKQQSDAEVKNAIAPASLHPVTEKDKQVKHSRARIAVRKVQASSVLPPQSLVTNFQSPTYVGFLPASNLHQERSLNQYQLMVGNTKLLLDTDDEPKSE